MFPMKMQKVILKRIFRKTLSFSFFALNLARIWNDKFSPFLHNLKIPDVAFLAIFELELKETS